MRVAETMKRIRLEIGLSQKEWSRAIDMDPSSICLYEKGERYPSPKTIRKIIAIALKHNIKVKFADLVEI